MLLSADRDVAFYMRSVKQDESVLICSLALIVEMPCANVRMSNMHKWSLKHFGIESWVNNICNYFT